MRGLRPGSHGRLLAASLLVLFALTAAAQPAASASDSRWHQQLRGTINAAQNHTYIEVAFAVPAGVKRVTLTFAYTGHEQHTVLDIGMADSVGLRCWSGGNKSTLTAAEADATPSCLPGRLPQGTWKLVIGVPNIRAGLSTQYTADISFSWRGLVQDEPQVLRAPIRASAGWYRGDLHMHTAHSDGSCASQSGARVPCPVYLTADAAARRGLDFIAITDHNTTSHYDAMRELTPYFDKLLLIPGREITTFQGHANLFGTEDFVDFRLGSADVPDVNTLLKKAQETGALVSLNHPESPTGEICMGCGWTPSPAADMRLVQAVEAINSGAEEGPYSGTRFWEDELNHGYRLTAVGGSDNHNATKPLDQVGSIGSPTTVVYARELSTAGILDGIRAGHVFIDLTASHDRLLELRAVSGNNSVGMGDALDIATGSELHLESHIVASQGAVLMWIEDGAVINGKGSLIDASDRTLSTVWKSDGRRHWIRSEVRGPDGHLWLLGNPVYINWSQPAH